jgi:hypothetical protein
LALKSAFGGPAGQVQRVGGQPSRHSACWLPVAGPVLGACVWLCALTAGPVRAESPVPAAPAVRAEAKWGEGVLELDFLRKLRVFLETDPFDFKAFELVFGVGFNPDPPNGPNPGGSWGMNETRRAFPFGQTFNNRSVGGVRWSFDSSRNTSYVAMEFVKMPPAGKREGDGLPCITPEQIKQVFENGWVGETAYREIRMHLVTTLVPGQQSYKWRAETPQEAWMNYPIESCVPRLSVSFRRLPPHPASTRKAP